MIYAFKDYIPVVHPTAFVHPLAAVTGNVIIGKDVYIGPGAAIRGDWGAIIIKDGCNVQENCTIHMFPGIEVILEEGAHIGHGAIIHGAYIGKNVLIGMNSVIMDEAQIGHDAFVGAMSFVKARQIIEPRSLYAGNPARYVRELSDEMIAWKSEGTHLYQQLPAECHASLRPCEPLTEMPADRPVQQKVYSFFSKPKEE